LAPYVITDLKQNRSNVY